MKEVSSTNLLRFRSPTLIVASLLIFLVACDTTSRPANEAPAAVPTLAVAMTTGDGYESLKSAEDLSNQYFKETLTRHLNRKDLTFARKDGLFTLSGANGTKVASIKSVQVQELDVTDKPGETRPYLVMKANKANGNCMTTAIPVVESNGFMYTYKDAKASGITTLNHPEEGNTGCDYTHSCSGNPCSSCDLDISSDGCDGSCDCDTMCLGACSCNHSVSN